MLQHRLFNLTPNMLEVGHPKRSQYDDVTMTSLTEMWCVHSVITFDI